jgi:uncharacterized Zn-finger protein
MTAQKKIEITSHDLPLSCPTKQEALWSAHPKVYLSIEKTGEAACPYCGTAFHMVDFQEFKKKSKGH